MKVGIIDHFDSMHFIPGHPKCGNPHGHTYSVEVSVAGNPANGMIIDFDELKGKIKSVLNVYDHKNLNNILQLPSCENITIDLHERLQRLFTDSQITVKVWEGSGKWSEYP